MSVLYLGMKAIKLSISSPPWEFSTNWVCPPEFSFIATTIILLWRRVSNFTSFNIFNKILVCCKLRPIVFNFPFRRNQFLPKRHFSGRLANSSQLIFLFLDPFLYQRSATVCFFSSRYLWTKTWFSGESF